MTNKEIMFIVLYRWRIKPELEDQFVEAWSQATEYYRENHGSLGSRLHRGSDGFFYGYAQWKSAEDRRKAFEFPANSEAGARMREAIAESFTEIILENLSDYLILPETR
jgi:heme-degrading monooxygenase HmoA